jgi:hypothetical protein
MSLPISQASETPHESRDAQGVLKPQPKHHTGAISASQNRQYHPPGGLCLSMCGQCNIENKNQMDVCIKKCESNPDTFSCYNYAQSDIPHPN